MPVYLGIDIGGTHVSAGLVTASGQLLARLSVPSQAPRPAEALCHTAGELCRRLLREQGVNPDQVAAAGAGCPGIIREGTVRFAANLRLRDVPLAQMLSRELELPVSLCNDAAGAAYGEYLAGCGKGSDPFVLVTLGTGIGGGIVVNGRLLTGFNGAGGEIGHIVLRAGGRPCRCGRRGCLEAYCSGAALAEAGRRAMEKHPESLLHGLTAAGEAPGVKQLFDAAGQGDRAAKEVLRRYVKDLACGLQTVVDLIQPRVLCLGGGISGAGEALFAPLRQAMAKQNICGPHVPCTELRPAVLGNDAGIIGAALYGKNSMEEHP